MTNVPACRDCVYFGGGGGECFHPKTQTFDIVDGIRPGPCRTARHGECGLPGRLFKRRADIPDWVIRGCLLGAVALTVVWSFMKAMGW